MTITEGTLAKLDFADRLHRLPDTALLTTELAAAFLSSSVTSLERMRVKGSGPAYSQGGAYGARGTNHKCVYMKAGLLAWHEANKVTSSRMVAVRKGQAWDPYAKKPSVRTSGQHKKVRPSRYCLTQEWDLISCLLRILTNDTSPKKDKFESSVG